MTGSVVAPIPMSGLIQVKQQLWGAVASQYFILLKNKVIGYTRLIR